ncbi:MAG: hypothetical protein ACI8RN_000059 [Glaciecola sp.]|jgi:hypothetical protein|uniref:metallophosphoesterase n=1 Tax=Congregibacter sp. TaxID=2744308 RepID=UPI0039E328D3
MVFNFSSRLSVRPLKGFCLALVLSAFSIASALGEQWDWQGVDRVVAVADVHGDYDNYMKVLEQAELVNRRGRWIGGATHLVQLGDVPDRGPDTAKIIRHLMKLETEAKKAGGRVHALIGNHEVMNMTGDLRYVDPGEYAALKTRKSRNLQEGYYQQVVDYLSKQEGGPALDQAFEEKWLAEHPVGFVEHRQHWHPNGEFGAWVANHNTVIRINRSLFLHGGISPEYLDKSLESMNDAVRVALTTPTAGDVSIIDDENGPLWYRGLSMGAQSPEIAAHVANLQQQFEVDRVVVGHTPGFGTIVPRYDARVLAADSGISEYYGGHLASVLIVRAQAFTVQRGQPVPLPSSDAGLLQYYQAINEIEPDVNNLMAVIGQLKEAQRAQ